MRFRIVRFVLWLALALAFLWAVRAAWSEGVFEGFSDPHIVPTSYSRPR